MPLLNTLDQAADALQPVAASLTPILKKIKKIRHESGDLWDQARLLGKEKKAETDPKNQMN